MAGVALGDIYLRLAWQAWHLETSTFVSRGRRGTWRHLPAFHVAGVAVGDIYFRFTWQAWHLVTSTFVLRGRRGTWRHPPSFCVAGVALGDIHLRFAWQAWHLATSTFVLSPTIFVTHNFVTHHIVTHTTSFYFSILRHLVLCLSFLPRPRYNIWCSLLEEVALWGYPVL